jgi:uncharacterized protein (TIGR03067 family)
MVRYIMTALAVGMLVAAQDATKDKAELQGSWRAISSERDGQVQEDARDHLLIFAGDTLTIKKGDQVFAKGTFTLDATQSPKTIDLKITAGPVEQGKDVKAHGIYELRAGTLRWCSARPGGEERPKQFTSKEGPGHLMVTLKKEK